MAEQISGRNIYQRLLEVAEAVGRIAPSSKNQYGKAAIGIADIENEVRGALCKAGIITRWTCLSPPEDVGNGKLWRVELGVTMVSVDDPSDSFTDKWSDIGTSPMAAASFARKGYYKSLFHIGEEGDDKAPHQAEPRPSTQTRASNQPPRPAEPAKPAAAQANEEHLDSKTRGLIDELSKLEHTTVPVIVNALKHSCGLGQHDLITDADPEAKQKMIAGLEARIAKAKTTETQPARTV